MTISDKLPGRSWDSAIECATGRIGPAIPNDKSVSLNGFTMDDIESVIASREGENDELSWLAAFGLKDGRFVYIEAWCDYTGWDCRSGGSCSVASNAADLIRFGMGDGSREALGLKLD